jgi:hypothetical protein
MAMYYVKRPRRQLSGNFAASNELVCRFKDCHGLLLNKLTGESDAIDKDMRNVWLDKLLRLLEGYEPQDIYNADEMGLFYNFLLDRMLALTAMGGKVQTREYCDTDRGSRAILGSMFVRATISH